MAVYRWLKGLWQHISYLALRYYHEGHSARAASLAYTTLLAMVPMMIVVFTILSFFPFFQGAADKFQAFILANFVATSATALQAQLSVFMRNVGSLSTVNLVFLFVVGIMLINAINNAFNSIWRTEHRIHFSLSFLLYFVVLLLSPVLIALVMFLGTFLLKLPYVSQLMKLSYVHRPILISLPYVLIFITFTVLNWALPSCKVRFAAAIVGGLITTILFELAKYGFALYLIHFPTYRLLYGALAAIPIFLVWLFVSWSIILLGALITNLVAVGIVRESV